MFDVFQFGNLQKLILDNPCWDFRRIPMPGPTAVNLGVNKTAVSISAGLDFTCALLNTGEVSCWGDNSYGIFADGTTTDSNTPVIVNHSIGESVVSISTPGYSVCVISSSGSISCWGYSYTISSLGGQLTNGSISLSLDSGRSAISIQGTNSHACAILDNGSINCWGVNTYGQLGNGENTDSVTPQIMLVNPSSFLFLSRNCCTGLAR